MTEERTKIVTVKGRKRKITWGANGKIKSNFLVKETSASESSDDAPKDEKKDDWFW